MRKYLTEFIGTFFLVLVVGSMVIGASGGAAASMIPVAIGATLMVMVFAGGHISGAHYNPAVTLAVLIRGRIALGEATGYVVAQILAAVLAAYINIYLLGDKVPAEAIAIADPVKGLVAEVLGTFALAYVVLNAATSKNTAGNSFYGLAIGFTVAAMAYALGPYSGGAFNPAVATGGSLLRIFYWGDFWIYLAGCFGGGLLAAIVFRINNPDDK